MKIKIKYIACILALACLLALSGCIAAAPEETTTAPANAQASTPAPTIQPKEGQTVILLKDGETNISGGGASVSGDVVTISAAGEYVISGALSDGQIVINAGADDDVTLILSGVTITNRSGAPIYGVQADKVIITLAEGSDNHLFDAADYNLSAGADEPNAAIFVKDDLTINGPGSLSVTANFNNGIGTKDDLVITGGVITVTAPNHAIRGRDSITITGGVFDLTSGADGLQANNDEKEDKGWILIEAGVISIASGNDGIQAETSLTINGGVFSITSGDKKTATSSGSYKGLKSGSDMVITGGVFTIVSVDDTIHSNGNLTITGGDFGLNSGDDAIHSDSRLTIESGNVKIHSSYEGLEGAQVSIAGGIISIIATNDGINAAGGANSGAGGFFGMDRFNTGSGDYYIEITGGEIYVDAQGDGIDSNNEIRMSGGVLYINGPSGSGNGAIDYDRSFAFTGGTIAAAGSTGMAQAPSSASQPVLMVYFSSTQQGGTSIALKDASGSVLVELTPTRSFQCIVLSADGTAAGNTCGLYVNGAQTAQLTLAEGISYIDEAGNPASTGGRGMPGGGGGGRR